MFRYNPNYPKRDNLLGIESKVWDDDSDDDIIRIDNLPLAVLEKLVDEKFIDPNGCQNRSPSTMEFLNFVRSHPSAKVHGYAVSPYRDDYRFSIEGLFIDRTDVTPENRQAFSKFCENADWLELGCDLYSWWD
jgi:hypothetical protein